MPTMLQNRKMLSTNNSHRALPAPRRTSLPARQVSALREGLRLRKRGLYLGTAPDGLPFYLKPAHLRTHLHVLGATGTEKSRLMLWLFKLLCHTNRPIVLADFKGGLVEMVRNWALANGYAKRLVLFDMSAPTLLGYNPLRENGLRLDLQAQWISEGIKSAWGQATYQDTLRTRDGTRTQVVEGTVKPDSLFLLTHSAKGIHYFPEADRSTMSNARYLAKLKSYYAFWATYVRDGRSPIKQMRVLTITRSEERKQNLRKIANQISPEAKNLFWFICEKAYLGNPQQVFAPTWQTLEDNTLKGLYTHA
jgi:protein involved in plasmid replication-relaxation